MTHSRQSCLMIVIAGLVFTLLSPTGARSAENLYWHLDEYLEEYPQQKELMDSFYADIRAPAKPLAAKQKKPLNILAIYPGLQTSDYWDRSIVAFETRLKEIGIQYDLSFHLTHPTELPAQSQLIEQSLRSDPDFLVFTLDALRHKGLISRVMGRGNTRIILQNITTPIKSFGNRQPFLYDGFDHEIGTRMLADHYKKLFPGAARYAAIFPTQGYVSEMRGDVFLQEMASRGDIQLLDLYFVPINVDRSYTAAMELLSAHESLDFIYAGSTDIALGIVKALKETGRIDEIVVNGWGGGKDELTALSTGELNFTVMRMNDDNGVAMAEAIRMFLEGDEARIPTVFSGEIHLVDQSTPTEQLREWTNYAFRYSR